MNLDVSTRDEGDVTIVFITGEVDVFSAPALRDQVNAVIERGRHRLIIDLTGVPFLDSTGLGVLVGRLKTVRQEGGELRLVISSDRLLRNFNITGLDKVFRIHPDPDAALAEMS